MGVLGKLKLLLQAKHAADAIQEEVKKGMDWKITLVKGLKDLVVTSVAVLGAYFADPTHLAVVLGVLPATLKVALIPLLSSAITAGLNAWKNRNKL